MIDREKGRMRIRTKVCVALAVVISCTAIGTIVVHFMEDLSWVDIFYLSVTSDSRLWGLRIHGLGRKTFRHNLASDKHIGSGRGD